MNSSQHYFLLLVSLLIATTSFTQSKYDHTKKGQLLYEEKKYSEALIEFEKALELDSSFSIVYYNSACCASLLNQKKMAFNYLEKSIETGYMNISHLKKDSDFNNIKKKRKWKKIINLLNNKIDTLINDDFLFRVNEKSKVYNFKSKLEITNLLMNGFHLMGTGVPKYPPSESYSNLISSVFQELENDNEIRSLINSIIVNQEGESMAEINSIIKSSKIPIIFIKPIILTDFMRGGFISETFYINVIFRGDVIYEISGGSKGKGIAKISYSDNALEKLKTAITTEIKQLLQE